MLPDLECSIKGYVNNPSSEAALEFMKETCLGLEKRARGFMGLISTWLGNSQHLWMWDFKSIKPELENVGFVEVRRAFFGDSSDPYFRTVEEIGRWENCLGIECRKLG